jgi:hypothetical protein
MVTVQKEHAAAGRVRWLPAAVAGVEAALKDQFEVELERVFDESVVTEITVRNVYASYGKNQAEKVILGVGARSSDRYESHIVKLGTRKEAGRDFDGWRGCAGNRYIGSRIFVHVHAEVLAEDRVGVVYEDAQSLFGLDPSSQQPVFLEDAVEWAVLDDKPDPVSVERALCQIYGDLHRWFYFAGRSDPAAAKAFYVKQMEKVWPKWEPPEAGQPLPQCAEADDSDPAKLEWRNTLRADATWLLGGLDPPDFLGPTVYFDPVDYVRWALDCDKVPQTLVGCSHGDVHGRNILVGVRRGEAEFPILIDYGNMDPANVLAWDFAKLEMELKTRLLPKLCEDSEVVAALLNRRGDKPPRKDFPEDRVKLLADEEDRAARARRLAFCFEFETLLADASRRIEGQLTAESRQPPGGRPVFPTNRKLDRALTLFLRIRQEAALWIGYKQRRHTQWRDEIYFSLAVYGLITVKWDTYEPQQTECALVAAGVAVARMEQSQRALRELNESKITPTQKGPSYRPRLALAHRLINANDFGRANEVIEQALKAFPHAVPLRAESALIRAEMGELATSLRVVDPLRRLCWIFGDHETLTRIGRTYKNLGDKEWERLGPPYAVAARGTPVWQLYREALVLYRDAYAISRGNYFPGVNVVTLALLTGDHAAAQENAEKVLATCQGLQLDARGEALYWIFVSEGEAALGCSRANRDQLARSFYASALALVGPGEIRMVQASWNQLCRLWHIVDRSSIGPAVEEFSKRNELWKILNPGPVGDCGCVGKR